ncbi:MAG: hypothetical protein H0U21_15785, partial [Acidimicrobiia bacterium]|nr:hypothetical protein [Acidimicrobiia bacterium]
MSDHEVRASRPSRPVIGAVVATVPIVVATVRALARGWTPLGDNGLLLLRTQDVLTSNHPLLGTWTSASLSAGRNINNPGPLWFDLLAPFEKVAGPSVGFAVGVMAANVGAVVLAAWAAQRVGGETASAVVSALSAGLAWSMGSELLFDAWQPHSMLLPCWALLILAWCVAHGDLAVAPWLLGVASLLVQTHLSYTYLVPLLVGGALVTGVVVHRRGDGSTRPLRPRRAVVLATVVVVLAWVQPLIDQVAGRGNLGRLLAAGDSQGPRLGAGIGVRLVAAVVGLPPWWTRPGFSGTVETLTSSNGPDGPVLPPVDLPGRVPAVAGMVLVLALIVAAFVVGRQRTDTRLRAAGVVAALGVAGALISTTLIPVGIGISPHQMRWLWPMSAFVTLILVLTVV